MVDRFAEDWRTAGLDEGTEALLEYAERLTTDVKGCGSDDVAVLREAGWDDRGIHDAAQIVAYFNYINRVAEGLGIEPETWIDPTGRPL
ncbi:MAG: peroxidase [Actinomycetota bacterium]